MKTVWDLIVNLYQTNFNIPPRIVDLMSIDYVLCLCASGRCNSWIANDCGWDNVRVENVLKEYLNFSGWDHDLDISPISVYNEFGRDYRLYKMNILLLTKLFTKKELSDSFYVCKRYITIRKEIDKYVK